MELLLCVSVVASIMKSKNRHHSFPHGAFVRLTFPSLVLNMQIEYIAIDCNGVSPPGLDS